MDKARVKEVIKDICNFNYVNLIDLFSDDFNPDSSNSQPTFHSIEAEKLEDHLLDLLFLTSNFKLNAAHGRAIVALGEFAQKKVYSEEEKEAVFSSLKKISSIFTKILSKEKMQLYVKVIKRNQDLHFEEANYKKGQLQAFSSRLQKQFVNNIERIENDLQSDKIKADLLNLFPRGELMSVNNYNEESSNFFISIGYDSFQWIMPIQILKTFVFTYFGDEVKALLNDVVVEGFFNSPEYKSDFAQKIFSCGEAKNKIIDFENSFEKEKENDIAVMRSWGREANKNPDFGRRLSTAINKANYAAQHLLEELVTSFKDSHTLIGRMLEDSHKVNSDDITNIKMLFNSSRNRDFVEILEKQYPHWQFFLEIMKNYVIVFKKSGEN